MAKGFSISLSGLQTTLKKLEKQGDKILDECDDELAAGAEVIAKTAKRLAPVDTGRLRAAISASKNGKLSWEIVAQTDYAAYVEFGTGKKVEIPNGLDAYARQFKGKGKRLINRRAQPFFFPAIFQNRRNIIKNIVKVLKTKRDI